MSEMADLSNEELQREHARVLVMLEGLQEQVEEVMALGESEGVDPEDLDARLQAQSATLRELEAELQRRGLG